MATLGIVFFVFFLIFLGRVWVLQINQGDYYFQKSENNRLRNSLIFAKRGLIYDRAGTELAWNSKNSEDKEFNLRKYLPLDGFSHLLGYVKYPSKDKYGFYFSEVFTGIDGVEKAYNEILSGQNGKRIVEVDALGKILSENTVKQPIDGEDLTLSIDAGLQAEIYKQIKTLADKVNFTGGAGIIMDVTNGEVLALTSYPEYNSQILTDGVDKTKINNFFSNSQNPSLNRVVDGLYTPGSTVKPFMAFAALNEKVIDPLTNILSTGSISIPNPYDPKNPSVFRDWKAHGYVDMRKALAVSSDVYFYEIGGGFQAQKGLGIGKIDDYMQLFGFGTKVPASSSFFSGPQGIIPTPTWKATEFNGEDWRIGNTYHTSIGQYGFQVSPLQLVRAVSALANGGKLLMPEIILNQGHNNPLVDLKLDQNYLKIVREGMHDGVVKDYGVAHGLYSPNYSLGAKTGTAELGVNKQFVNSWVSGFFPYEDPHYAFVIIMERGPVSNTTGALFVMRQVFDWLNQNRPEYLK